MPSVVGKSEADAVAEITRAGLEAHSVPINSGQPAGTVTAQAPAPGRRSSRAPRCGSTSPRGRSRSRCRRSSACSTTRRRRSSSRPTSPSARDDVDSDEPKGTVVAQDPAGNSTASKGSTVRLSVSKGPATIEVPDVTGLDLDVGAPDASRRRLQGHGHDQRHGGRDARRPRRLADAAREHAGRAGLVGGDRGVAVRATARHDGHDHARRSRP